MTLKVFNKMENVIVFFLEIIFVYPGAFLRWLLFNKDRKLFKDIVKDDLFKNSSIGVVAASFILGVSYSAYLFFTK